MEGYSKLVQGGENGNYIMIFYVSEKGKPLCLPENRCLRKYSSSRSSSKGDINLLLIPREVCSKTTERQYFLEWLKQARLLSSLSYGTVLVEFAGFWNKKYTAYPYGKIPTEKEPIITLAF